MLFVLDAFFGDFILRWASFSYWPLIESLFRENRREVIGMQAITHASAGLVWNWRDRTVAIIIARRGVVEHAMRNNLPATGCQLNDFVSVPCFSSISIVHN